MEQDGVFAARRSRQEKARIDAETQMEIADEMSRMVSEEYQEDILDHMEVMEVGDHSPYFIITFIILIQNYRPRLYQMLLVSTSRLKSSGSCVRISSIFSSKPTQLSHFSRKPCSLLSIFSTDTVQSVSSTSATINWLDVQLCLSQLNMETRRIEYQQYGSWSLCAAAFTIRTCLFRWSGTCSRLWTGLLDILRSTASCKWFFRRWTMTLRWNVWRGIFRRLHFFIRILSAYGHLLWQGLHWLLLVTSLAVPYPVIRNGLGSTIRMSLSFCLRTYTALRQFYHGNMPARNTLAFRQSWRSFWLVRHRLQNSACPLHRRRKCMNPPGQLWMRIWSLRMYIWPPQRVSSSRFPWDTLHHR